MAKNKNPWTSREVFMDGRTKMFNSDKSSSDIEKNLGWRVAVLMRTSLRNDRVLGVSDLTMALNGWRWAAVNLSDGDDAMTAFHKSAIVSEKLEHVRKITPTRTILGAAS